MPILKYRLNRKNASGSYDTIHYETSSNIVMRPSGRSVEQDLAAYLPRTQDTDDVPQSLTSGLIMLSPGKVYYKLNADIYIISSSIYTRHIWNKYNILILYSWNRYSIKTSLEENEYTGFGILPTTANGEPADINMRYKAFCDFLYISKPQYTLNSSYRGSFKISNNPDKRYDSGDTIMISGTRKSSTSFNVTSMDGYDDCWFCEISSDVSSDSPPHYAERLYHFATPHGAHQNGDSIDINYGGNSKWYTVSVLKTKGSYIDQVTSSSSSAYPANNYSGSYWYVSVGSQQTQGSFIDTVESNIENAYPDNGIQDGYWYVKQ